MKMQGLSPRWEADAMLRVEGDEAKKKRQAEMFKCIDASPEGKTESGTNGQFDRL